MSFDAGYWEDRYRSGQGTGRHDPGPSLVAEAAGLPPGRALDAGCGAGADARWLAGRGWRVTAVDVVSSALEHGRQDDDAVAWVQADLTTWEPPEPFDLVTCSYVHVPGPPEELFARLASWVVPGGTLLVVGHAGHGAGRDHDHDHGDARPAGAQVALEQVTGVLSPDAWDVLVAEPRTHRVRAPRGEVALSDVVVRARRR